MEDEKEERTEGAKPEKLRTVICNLRRKEQI